MAMTYTDLVASKATAGSIASWVNYSRLDADSILEQAQATIYTSLRAREMRTSATLALAAGDSTKALPTGFLDPIGTMRDTANNKYKQKTQEWLMDHRTYDADGNLDTAPPAYFAIFDELLNFDFKFDEDRALLLGFYKSPTALSAGNTTNFLTSRYPTLLMSACLAHAARFNKDMESYTRELQFLSGLIQTANVEADLSFRGADYDTEGTGE